MDILIHKTFFQIQFIHKLLPYLYNAILCYLTSINLQVDDLHKLILFVLFSVGRFESDALLVPRHCEFKHEHDTICVYTSICTISLHTNSLNRSPGQVKLDLSK
jgi:hypothetical protein